MYVNHGKLLELGTDKLLEDHTICHGLEIACAKLISHGRRDECNWGDDSLVIINYFLITVID